MNVGELEAQTGLGRDAIRFYERRGLLGAVPRSANNYRDYPPSLVKELKLLRSMQSLGFSLDEIGQVLEGLRSRGVDCLQGARLLAGKRERVEAQIRDLRPVSRVLRQEQVRLEERARKHGRLETA
jgi:DNA-binding transcriptional MerR regulator